MTVTVQEMFDYAIEYDLSYLAHGIYWALCEGKVQLTDSDDVLKRVEFDEAAIAKMKEDNVIGVGKVKLFVTKMVQQDWFAFYLAEHSLDAYRLHDHLHRGTNPEMKPADRLMIEMMMFAKTGEEMNLYEYKRKVAEYPAFVGWVKKGEKVVW